MRDLVYVVVSTGPDQLLHRKFDKLETSRTVKKKSLKQKKTRKKRSHWETVGVMSLYSVEKLRMSCTTVGSDHFTNSRTLRFMYSE
jgi:hypothetical protein